MQDFTDSYCERCGTRYTFGPPAPKGPSMATARVLARGLKNFVMNDSSTIDDAMAAARIDEERSTAAQVTEEFHRVFSFCMTCRQYACEKCWNPNQSACLSCAPLWDTEPVAPEDHLIVRTPATHGSPAREEAEAAPPETDLDEILRRRSADLAASDPSRRTAGEVRRASRQDQRAADRLRAQSESWKTHDDGWSLWPADEVPAAAPSADISLTPDELILVESELDTPPYQEPDEPQPKRSTRSPSKRPPAPSGRPAPSPEFDLLTSLRPPAELGTAAQPPAQPAEGRHAPVLGRLRGHRQDAPEAAPGHKAERAAPASGRAAQTEPAKPTRGAKQGKERTAPAEPAESWPHATPWTERPIARQDWGAEPEAVAGPAEPAVDEPPAQWEEAVQWEGQAPTAPDSGFAQTGPEIEQSPASWLAAARRSPDAPHPEESPSEPEPPLHRTRPVDVPAGEGTPATTRPATEEPAAALDEPSTAWPPVGAQWPSRKAPTPASWPPADTTVAASMAARDQLDQAQQEEAGRVSEMWLESAQRVLDQGSVRVCYRCSLPLSTHARFCRRCGTNQQA